MSYEFSNNPYQYAEQVLKRSKAILYEAVGIVSPEDPEADPLQVFPAPNMLRAEDVGIALTPDQEENLMERAANLGFGRAEDVTLSEQGLFGSTVIIEGGQPHKMMAELLVVMSDQDANPRTVIVGASEQREITNPAEQASAERLLGHVSQNEYEVAKDAVRSLPGFVEAVGLDNVIHFGYDIHNNFATHSEPSEQFRVFGYLRGAQTSVILMRIDREDYTDDSGAAKYRNQPGTADVVEIVHKFRKRTHRLSDEPIVLATSGVYRPSRAVSLARAGLTIDRLVGLTTYGNDTINLVRGTDSKPPVNQLPGELHKMAQEVKLLEQTLTA